jgi:similar to stage IV sporulation protein
MKPHYAAYSIVCESPARLFALIKSEHIEASEISQKGDEIRLCVPFTDRRRFEELLESLGAEYREISRGSLYRLPQMFKARFGLVLGAAICAAAVIILQNFAVSIEVLTEDDDIRESVMSVLYDCGVKPGTYIPSVNLVQTERALKQKAEGISWAGISVTDSTLIIDVIENIPQPKRNYERVPSNLIATHDAVIEDIELYNGTLVKTLGSAVVRGDIIVSGTVEKETTEVIDGELVTEKSEKYVRSVGKIYGEYTEVQTFEQPFSESRLVYSGETESRKYLSVFSYNIPLFFKDADGFYKEDEEYEPLRILGEETPVGIRTKTYSEYYFQNVSYTKEQARALAVKMRDTYEENFLTELEIRGRKSEVTYTDSGVVLTVRYKIYGQISEESEFFVSKSQSKS